MARGDASGAGYPEEEPDGPAYRRSSPMSKRRYRAVDVKSANFEAIAERVSGEGLVVGVDAGKEEFRAALMLASREVVTTVKWRHPGGSLEAVEWLLELPVARLEVAMEPTGRYGDAVRGLLLERGVSVYRVSPKRVHDLREAYDGTPSSHDSKSAALVAKLHWDGASEPWPLRSERERELVSAVRLMGIYEQQKQSNLNRLEAHLARHWPELLELVTLGSATQLALVGTYGSPEAVAQDPAGARTCMHRASRGALKPEKVEAVLASAQRSVGVSMVAGEREAVRELVAEIRHNDERLSRFERQVHALVADEAPVSRMAEVLGTKTAAALVAELGDPGRYRNASCYEKALGLNLVEDSSGLHQGLRRISKRGPGLARWYLYLAVLRLIQRDGLVRAWYEAKVARDGGVKGKALVAVMRKLSRALWHVVQGSRFDARLLFDASRLEVA